jgi:hypothetical protein
MASPEISVVIPTRDRAPLLQRAILCAFDQQDVALELIAVDDGSSDGTQGLLRSIRDPRLRTLRLSPAAGVARARNEGVALARGRWIAFLDDDDLWAPHKLRAQLDVAKAARADFVYASGFIVDEHLAVLRLLPAPTVDGLFSEILRWNVIGGPSTMLIRRDILERAGGFDERLSVLADWDLWARLASSNRPAACPEPLVAFVRHSGSMQTVQAQSILEELGLLEEKHQAAREEHGVQVDADMILRSAALGHLRAGHRLHAARLLAADAVTRRRPPSLAAAGAVLAGEWAIEVLARLRGRRVRAPDWLRKPQWP